jgi:hypothetical protein
MEKHIADLFKHVINELAEKATKNPKDNTYNLILRQIEFLQNCLINKKNMLSELNGRELNFNVIASKNLSGPDAELQEQISDISIYIDEIYNL